MKVFKFGGASVKDAAGIKNVASIIQKYGEKDLVVVVSATWKTTNALEVVIKSYFDNTDAKAAFDLVKKNHHSICMDLFGNEQHEVFDKLQNIHSNWVELLSRVRFWLFVQFPQHEFRGQSALYRRSELWH